MPITPDIMKNMQKNLLIHQTCFNFLFKKQKIEEDFGEDKGKKLKNIYLYEE